MKGVSYRNHVERPGLEEKLNGLAAGSKWLEVSPGFFQLAVRGGNMDVHIINGKCCLIKTYGTGLIKEELERLRDSVQGIVEAHVKEHGGDNCVDG